MGRFGLWSYMWYIYCVFPRQKKPLAKINTGINNQSPRTNPAINNCTTHHCKSQNKSQVVLNCGFLDGTELKRSPDALLRSLHLWIATICYSDCMYVWCLHSRHPREISNAYWGTVAYPSKTMEGESFLLSTLFTIMGSWFGLPQSQSWLVLWSDGFLGCIVLLCKIHEQK